LDDFLRRRRQGRERAERVALPIIAGVRRRGDRAVAEYARRFDGYDGPLRLDREVMAAAWKRTPAELRDAMRRSAANIRSFAILQRPLAWMKALGPGVTAGQIVRPLQSAGCYAPGGRYPLPSTALMTAIPARVAGVAEVAVACPGGPEVVLAAAHAAGADVFYPVGGVQAIAAMAYGTQSIARVSKIVGPGNVYVIAAKRIVAADTGIDFLAGPTEIVLVAKSGRADWLAADMIAQAEHDPSALALLLTPSPELAAAVAGRIARRWRNCAAVVTRNVSEALDLANRIAPEHLWLADRAWLKSVRHAGSVFLGPHSPVAAGDYATGPNHTLPTGGAARWRGGLSALDFLKIITVQKLDERGLRRLAPAITTLARAEGLEHHARSVEARLA
jgi:histidinol dehydrogenase